MRLTTVLLTAVVALSEAATLNNCAGKCIGEAIAATHCSSADSGCICSSDSFMSSILECVPQTCTEDEHEYAITFAEEFCHKIELAKRTLEPESAPAAPVERRDASAWNLLNWAKRTPSVRRSPQVPPHMHKAAPMNVPWYKRGYWGSTISGSFVTVGSFGTVGTVGTVNTVGTVGVYGRNAHWPPPGGPGKWGVGKWR